MSPSLPPCALAVGTNFSGDRLECRRCLTTRFFWPWILPVASVRCDPPHGQIYPPADDLESWRRLGGEAAFEGK